MAAVSGRGAVAEEEFSERELEVAAILIELPSIVRAERRRHRRLEKQQQQQRPEIPTWGRRRPRKAPAALVAAEKPAAAIAPAAAAEEDHRRARDGAASPDTPLAFPVDDHEAEDEEDHKKAAAQDEWVQQQRGEVASLSHENAHLLKQIEEFRARLETSRSTHDSLNQMQQSKHKKRNRPEEEEEARRWKLQACAAADRPALDLNEPAEADAEDAKPQIVAAQWCHQLQQLMQQKAAQTAAARRRRREIRRAKASAGSGSRTRRLG